MTDGERVGEIVSLSGKSRTCLCARSVPSANLGPAADAKSRLARKQNKQPVERCEAQSPSTGPNRAA